MHLYLNIQAKIASLNGQKFEVDRHQQLEYEQNLSLDFVCIDQIKI